MRFFPIVIGIWLSGCNSVFGQEAHTGAVDAIVRPKQITNVAGMKLVLIPAGEYVMGSPEDEPGREDIEIQHKVSITRPFYLGSTEVTLGQYLKVMRVNPRDQRAPTLMERGSNTHPVSRISWLDAVDFCVKLSELPAEKKAGRVYRLPTEAEWEYACRAGSTTSYSFGSSAEKLGDFGWFRGNSGGQPHPVAKKKPNAWGLFDMHGNVWEWCSDYVGPYAVGDIADPQGPNEGVPDISGDEDPYRIYRGGSYASGVDSLRSAGRLGYLPTRRDETYGFRVAMSVSGK